MIWTSCKYFGLLDRFYCPVRISLSIFIVYFSKERIVTGKQRYKKLLNTANPMVFQWASISICKSCTLQGQKFFGRPLPVSFYVKYFFGNRGQVWDHSYYLVPSEPRTRDSESKTENWEHLDFSFLSFPCVFHYQLHLSGFYARKVNYGRYPAYFSC